MLFELWSLALSAVLVAASPVRPSISRRLSTQAVVPLSTTQHSELKTFANFAKASYCSSGSITNWACGDACDASPDVTHIDSGGDDDLIPGWYVVYSKPLNAIIVAHQGTNTKSLTSVLEDLVFAPLPLNPLLFPGTAIRGVLAHDGFSATQGFTAAKVLAAVETGVAKYGTNTVITTGHSLGAALATLDALFLKLQMPSLTVKNRVFASPRIGNPFFAAYFSTVVPDSFHMANKNDPVVHLGPLLLGFEHIPGEIYINPDASVGYCPGRENLHCSLGVPPDKFNWADHGGPYEGIQLGGCSV